MSPQFSICTVGLRILLAALSTWKKKIFLEFFGICWYLMVSNQGFLAVSGSHANVNENEKQLVLIKI
jgi:hypothetical protein